MNKKKVFGIATLIIFISVLGYLTLKHKDQGETDFIMEEEIASTYQPTMAYGIVIDSMAVFKDRVKKNQFLSDILLSYDVDYQKIDQLVKRA